MAGRPKSQVDAVAESTLSVDVTGSPPCAMFRRTNTVPDDLWFAIPVNLGPGVTDTHSGTWSVPLDRFLAGRRWLSDACEAHHVGVQLDETATNLLRRLHTDGRALKERIHRPTSSRLRAPATEGRTTLRIGRFSRRLRDFQERDLAQLLSLEHGANFSVPGAGKTAVTYALYEAEKERGRVSRLIVVAPVSAFEAWEREALESFGSVPEVQRFESEDSDAEVLLLSYQRLANYRSTISNLMLTYPTHLVLDEAHRMKRGQMGEWGAACLSLAHLATRRDILTGTPAPQSPKDLIAMIEFIWPGQSRIVLPADAMRRDPPDDAMSQVSSVLQPLFVRTTKRELDLDPPNITAEIVRPHALQSDIYDALRSQYAGMYDMTRQDAAILAQMGEVTMYLLEAATNPALLARSSSAHDPIPFRYPPLAIPAGSRLAELVASYSLHEVPAKLERLAVLVEQNASKGKKTLVWSNFVGNLLTLERVFARYQPALIYGGIPTRSSEFTGDRTRESELERFRSDDRCLVLIANPAATAEGISLHEICHDAIYLDRTFNAGQYLQSVDRIHRLGLRRGVTTNVTFILSEGTIDEAVDSRVRLKAARLAQMLNDPDLVTMALPDDEEYGEILDDVADLQAIFDHLAGGDR